jgi:hypothetical protein
MVLALTTGFETFIILIVVCPVLALGALGFALWVLAKAPWTGGVRVVVVGVVLAGGLAPLVWLVGLLDNLGRALGGLG